MAFTLKILEGQQKGHSYQFDTVEVTVGRTIDNDVVLPEPGISRQHFSIRQRGGIYIIKDLGSSNGTWLNGEVIQKKVLHPGDNIKVGDSVLCFKSLGKKQNARAESLSSRTIKKRSLTNARQAPEKGSRRQASLAKARLPRPTKNAKTQEELIHSTGMRRLNIKEDTTRDEIDNLDQQKGKDIFTQHDGVSYHPQPVKTKDIGNAIDIISRAKSWFQGLDKPVRIIVLGSAGLLLILFIIGIITSQSSRQTIIGDRWYDEEVFSPGKKVSRTKYATYGLGHVTYPCRSQVTFEFKYIDGRVTIVYKAGNISTKNEIEILLNNMQVGFVPMVMEEMSDRISFNLPRKHLLENSINKLTFVNTINSQTYANFTSKDEWAIALLAVNEYPLPSPDKQKAAEAFQRANDRFVNKNISPGNLYEALGYYKECRDWLELLPENKRPDIYLEASELIEQIEDELWTKFRSMLFEAEKNFKYRQYKQARDLFQLIMMTFPNQEDIRYQKGRSGYKSLEDLV